MLNVALMISAKFFSTLYLPSFACLFVYARPSIPRLAFSFTNFLNKSYTRSPTKILLYASLMNATLSSASTRLITLMLNVALMISAKFLSTLYLPSFASLCKHARPVAPMFAFSFTNFLNKSYARSPTKRLAYISLIYATLSFVSTKSIILMLSNGSTTSLKFPTIAYSSLPSTSTFALQARPSIPRFTFSSTNFLNKSYTRSPTKMSLYASLMNATLSSASIRLIILILRVALITSAKFLSTLNLPSFMPLL